MHTREYIYSLESTLASWHLDCSYIILLYSIDGCGDRVEVSKCVSVSGFLNSAYGGVAGRPNRCLWRQQFSQQGAKQEYINLLSINPARPPTSNLPPSIQSPTSTFKLEPMRTRALSQPTTIVAIASSSPFPLDISIYAVVV